MSLSPSSTGNLIFGWIGANSLRYTFLWSMGFQEMPLEGPNFLVFCRTKNPINRKISKSSYERHAIPNPSRLDAARQIVDRQPPCDLMCWKVIHGWRLERRAQRLFPFFTGALQTLSVNTSCL
jgi:hypothetical protein